MTSGSCVPSRSSCRISRRGAVCRSWTRGPIQSYNQSISSSSIQTTSTVTANYQAPFELSGRESPPLVSSGPSRNQDTSVPNYNSCHFLDPLTLRLRNESQSTISTILGPGRSGRSTTPSTPKQEADPLSLPSIVDGDASSLAGTLPSRVDGDASSLAGIIPSGVDNPASSVSPGPLHPLNANTVSPLDAYAVPGPPFDQCIIPTPLLVQYPRESHENSVTVDTAAPFATITSFPPASRFRSGAITTKVERGTLGSMTDFLDSDKRPKISTRYDAVHFTHIEFNSYTDESTGLPRECRQLLQDSGISRSDQEKDPLTVMEIVKFYQEGNDDFRIRRITPPTQEYSILTRSRQGTTQPWGG